MTCISRMSNSGHENAVPCSTFSSLGGFSQRKLAVRLRRGTNGQGLRRWCWLYQWIETEEDLDHELMKGTWSDGDCGTRARRSLGSSWR